MTISQWSAFASLCYVCFGISAMWSLSNNDGEIESWSRMSLPRYTKKDERQLAAELSNEDDTLGADLYKHLIWCLHEGHPVETAFTQGHAYRWVMDLSWLNECRRMALQLSGGRASYQNAEAQRAEIDYLLGLPIDVREDGGVPHLEPV